MNKVIENTNSRKQPEEWKPIPGYEGLYEVSNYGRVRSYKRSSKGKILSPGNTGNNGSGYLFVTLCKDGKAKPCTVHRLVADAFIPNPNKLSQVNHKDENKQNNYFGNLEWCSQAYNNSYGTRTQRMAENNSKPVLQLDKQGNVIKEWPSMSRAAESFGVLPKRSHIIDCLKGRHKTAHGYMWKYADKVQQD